MKGTFCEKDLFADNILCVQPVFAGDNSSFLNEPYTLTNLQVLEQRIENLKNDNYRHEDLPALPSDDYFYDVTLRLNEKDTLKVALMNIDGRYQGGYYLEFTVWKRNEKVKNSSILAGVKQDARNLLREPSFRKNVKVV